MISNLIRRGNYSLWSVDCLKKLGALNRRIMIEIDSHLVLVECIECFRFSLINAVDSDSGYFETQGFEERVEFYQF